MLTGLARKVQEGYDGYWKHILTNYNVDLYLHAWYGKPDGIANNENSDDVLKVYSKHGPSFLYIQNPFPFTEYRTNISNPQNCKDIPSNIFDVSCNFRCFPMFYSWESTYKHIINSDKEYDCIIRSRYDISGPPIDLYKLDLKKINTSSNHWRGSDIHDDNLCITNQYNSNKIFSNIFTDIIQHHKNIGYINNPEKNFTDYLKRHDLHKISLKNSQIDFSIIRK